MQGQGKPESETPRGKVLCWVLAIEIPYIESMHNAESFGLFSSSASWRRASLAVSTGGLPC
jgi:hypothetical protein